MHLLQFLAKLLGVLGLADDFFGDALIAIEKVEQFLADVVDQLSANLGVAQLVLGLGFEHGIFEPDRHGADHGFPDVVAFVFGVAVFVDGFEQAFAKGAQVRAAVGGILAVDERIKSFAIAAVAVGETDIFPEPTRVPLQFPVNHSNISLPPTEADNVEG